MNRGAYRPPPTSKASASTQCQKCLKRDNYECKAQAQERPYVARPSRTQQLANPKLAPKLSSDVPNDLMRKKGVADEQLAKSAAERGRKRSRSAEDNHPRKRSRSISSHSSDSVSTISTIDSRSASPRRRSRPSPPDRMMTSQFEEGDFATNSFEGKKRRRSSVSSWDEHEYRRSDRNTRRRRSERSPGERGRRRSREYTLEKRSRSNSVSRNRQKRRRGSRSAGRERQGRSPSPVRRRNGNGAPPPPRERSMSPYSKRLALTASMNTSR